MAAKASGERHVSAVIQARAARDPAFVAALLREAVELLLQADLPAARLLLRDAIKGSIGYADLSRRTGLPEKSLVRMFGPAGNPTIGNLARVLRELQGCVSVRLQVHTAAARGRRFGRRSAA